MKQLVVFFICIAGFANFAGSQPIWTDAGNKQIMEWDSSYNVEATEFRANTQYEIPYQYIIRKNNKVVAEYFRHDDSSYLFVRYDTLHKGVQRGLIKICSDTFKLDTVTLQIPVLNTDFGTNKEVFKDSILYDYNLSYRKYGLWWEKDSTSLIWKGNYENGLRVGEWKEGIFLRDQHDVGKARMYDNFRPFITHFFKEGVEILLYKDTLFWPLIRGGWAQAYKLSSNTVTWEREKRQPQYEFKNNQSVVVYLRHSQDPKTYLHTERKVVFWKQNNDWIEIYENGKQTILQVLQFTGDRMILRILQQDL